MSVVVLDFESRLLRGNTLRDPHARRVPVWLPPSYDAEPARRWPVIVWLGGFTADGETALAHRPFEPSVPERFERALARGEAREAILVMPDCCTRFGGSEYANSPATGRYFDHVADEIVPEIDRRFRSLAARDHRGVAGKSSGGIGALRFAMRRPDLFAACASHSGDMLFEVAYPAGFLQFCDAIGRRGGVEKFMREFPDRDPKSGEDVALANTIAMAQAYSPRTEPPGFDLPFDLETGELRSDVWARWLENDPVRMCERHADALRSLRLLYFDCGFRDEYHLHMGARALARRLRGLGVAFEHEEYDGTHRDAGPRYSISLGRISLALSP